jgi:hypothetical protein
MDRDEAGSETAPRILPDLMMEIAVQLLDTAAE